MIFISVHQSLDAWRRKEVHLQGLSDECGTAGHQHQMHADRITKLMSYIEHYHAPIRYAHGIVIFAATKLDARAALQIAVKSVRDSIGPDSLVPTLFVNGALPRLGFPNDSPTSSTFQRAIALRGATDAMTKNFSKSQLLNAVRTRKEPDTLDIHSSLSDSCSCVPTWALQVGWFVPAIEHPGRNMHPVFPTAVWIEAITDHGRQMLHPRLQTHSHRRWTS